MSFEQLGNYSFKWKIGNFNGSPFHRSPNFDLCTFRCYIEVKYRRPEELWLFSFNVYTLFLPFFYSMSVIGSEGREFFASKGSVHTGDCRNRVLMSIFECYLQEYLAEGDDLVVRFTFNPKWNAVDRENMVEYYLQKNDALYSRGKQSLATRDMSTNTDVVECYLQEKSLYSQGQQSLPMRDMPSNTSGFVEYLQRKGNYSQEQQSLPTKDMSTNTEENSASLLQFLSNDFKCFYESRTNPDCLLNAGATQFPAHRAVLSARSPVFLAMFHHDTAENQSGKVSIPDIKDTILGDILYYIYTGTVRGLTPNSATSMYTAADKYALIELRKECLEFLKYSLTTENICDAALLFYTHGESDLEEQVVRFMEDKLEEIVESDTWQQFLKTNTLLASKLLTSACMVAKRNKFNK